jgi:AcrR family transcriptional regulator
MDRVDGRHSRWDAHRAKRRRALVESALRAIRKHGAGVTLDDVAAMAQTSKTVLYRYFGDRVGLYLGVVDRVSENILGDLLPRLTASAPRGVGAVVHELVDAYTALVERDPEIYRFVINRPTGAHEVGDAVTSIEMRVAAVLAQTIAEHRARQGRPEQGSETLAYGLVGFVRAASDHWVASATDGGLRPRQELVSEVAALFGPGWSTVDIVDHAVPLTT